MNSFFHIYINEELKNIFIEEFNKYIKDKNITITEHKEARDIIRKIKPMIEDKTEHLQLESDEKVTTIRLIAIYNEYIQEQ